MLRRVTPDQVAVFVATSANFTATLLVRQVSSNSSQPPIVDPANQSPQSPIKLGDSLYVLVITLTLTPPISLTGDVVYEYDVRFTVAPGVKVLSDAGDELPGTPQTFGLSELGLLAGIRYVGLSSGAFPSFAIQTNRAKLRLIHGSCRKPHGGGDDAMPFIKSLFGPSASDRPHYLLLTGDQIYADDVSTSLLWTLQQTGLKLMGATDQAPNGPMESAETLSLQGKEVTILNSTAGQARRTLMTNDKLVTSEEKDSHLLFLAEFYAMYLLVWSPALWGSAWRPSSPPMDSEWDEVAIHKGWPKKTARSQHSTVAKFSNSTPLVRQVLANVSTLMMFDDHEVTDDWNINFKWARSSRTESPLLHRIVRNGLLAYGVFQAWGNDPDQFVTETTGRTLLKSLVPVPSSASTSNQTPSVFQVPGCVDDLLQLTPDVDSPPPTTNRRPMLWHWNIVEDTYDYKILALDTRTRRNYGLKETGLLTPEAMVAQLPKPLLPNDTRLTFVLSPAPVLGHPLMEEIVQPLAREIGKELFADAEAWSLCRTSLVDLMHRLALYRRIVLLSGDVHYGFTNKTEFLYWGPDDPASTPQAAVIAQLCASALHNTEGKTLAIQSARLAGLDQRAWRGREFAQEADHLIGGKNLAELMDEAINDLPAWVLAKSPVKLVQGVLDTVLEAIIGKSITNKKLFARVVSRTKGSRDLILAALNQWQYSSVLAYMYFRAIRADVPSLSFSPSYPRTFQLTVPVGPWFRTILLTAVDLMFPVPTSRPSQRTWAWSTTFIEADKNDLGTKDPYSRGTDMKRLMVVGQPHFGEVRVNSASNASTESLTHIFHLIGPSGTPSVVIHEIPSLTPPPANSRWPAVYK